MADQRNAPHYAAADIPGLRREMVDWYGGPYGVQFYANAIALGRQPIRPPGPAAQVAPALAAAETGRLRDGDLWYVDEDLCALLNAAHPSMPAFAPRPHDLPSKTGFAVFADPIAVYPAGNTRHDKFVDQLARTADDEADFRQTVDRLYDGQAEIVAVSWGPVPNPSWPAGGVWLSFYASSQLPAVLDDPAARAAARAFLPPLTVDNEAAVAWRPDGAPPDPYLLPTAGTMTDTTLSWARLVFAAFQLAAQANLAEREEVTTARPERRRTARAGLPPRDVRIVRLRRNLAEQRAAGAGGDSGREWRHRWVVRGHWRQHWYPSIQDRRPLWIAPYLKGPTDAPLLGGEKVTIATAPPGTEQ